MFGLTFINFPYEANLLRTMANIYGIEYVVHSGKETSNEAKVKQKEGIDARIPDNIDDGTLIELHFKNGKVYNYQYKKEDDAYLFKSSLKSHIVIYNFLFFSETIPLSDELIDDFFRKTFNDKHF